MVRKVLGLELTHPKTYESCGIIEPFYGDPTKHQVVDRGFAPFAGDGLGNAFVESADGRIHFWDHETDEVSELAENWDEFVSWCHEPQRDPDREL
jgi:hypothetical protein